MKKSLALGALAALLLTSPVLALDAPIVKSVPPSSLERVSLSIPGATSLVVREYRVKDSAIDRLASGGFTTSDLTLVRTVTLSGASGSLQVAASSGAYVYEARSGAKTSPLQAVLVSKISLAVARDDERSLLYVLDRSLAGVQGVSVKVVPASMTAGAAGTTDAKGTVELASGRGALAYVARSGAEVAIEKSDDRSGRWTPPKYLAQLSLDRERCETKAPLRLRATIREVREYGRDYWSPIGRTVVLYRSDNTGARTLVASGKVSIYGTFSASFTAPQTAGEYALELDVDGVKRVATSGLSVGAAAATIPLTAGAKVYRASEWASVSARVQPGASVHFLTIRTARPGAPDFEPEVRNSNVTAGSDGVAKLSFSTAKDADSNYFVEARVGDAVGSLTVPVTIAAYEVRVTSARNVHALADPIALRATVRAVTGDFDGDAARGARVTFSIVRVDENNKALSAPYSRWVDTDAQGTASLSLAASRSGKYRVTASVRDASGRTAHSERFFFVHDATLAWKPIYPEVHPDRETYAVGDMATVLVLSPVNGTALFAFGARELSTARGFVTIKNGVGIFTTRITSDMAPNCFATVLVPTAKGVAVGSRELLVPPADKLTVTVLGGGAALPGEKRALTVRVRDASGKPVRGEVQLAVVSEGVGVGPFADTFFGPLVRGVDLEVAPWSSGHEPSDENPDGVAPPVPELPRPRTPRPSGVAETLLWQTAVANALGDASFTLPLPGRGGRWRVVARVSAPWSPDLGEGTSTITVSSFTIDKAIAYWRQGATDFTYFASMAELAPWLSTTPHGRWVAFQRSENGESYFQVGENDLNHQDIAIDAVTGAVTVVGEH